MDPIPIQNKCTGTLIVNGWKYFLGALLEKHHGMARSMCFIENTILREQIADFHIDRPIFICGLARSGSTKLLEIVHSHPETQSLRYHNFPLLFMPFIWTKYLKKLFTKNRTPVERIHGDRIMVTPESPEAFEESIWMRYFPNCHDLDSSNILDREVNNPEFEKYYGDFIKRLLLAEEKTRYLAKANYNSTRLGYLLKLFPSARFIVPVREPVAQVGSLLRQHNNICRRNEDNPRISRHMSRIGHFEFGPHRKSINIGNAEAARNIQNLWTEGNDVEGYAHFWNSLYDHIADMVADNSQLEEAVLIVRYEDLCAEPEYVLNTVFDHLGLDNYSHIVDRWGPQLSRPQYYSHGFTEEQEALIKAITAGTANRYRYDSG